MRVLFGVGGERYIRRDVRVVRGEGDRGTAVLVALLVVVIGRSIGPARGRLSGHRTGGRCSERVERTVPDLGQVGLGADGGRCVRRKSPLARDPVDFEPERLDLLFRGTEPALLAQGAAD